MIRINGVDEATKQHVDKLQKRYDKTEEMIKRMSKPYESNTKK